MCRNLALPALLSAAAPDGSTVRASLDASDVVEARRMDDMPRASLAWTGAGFLVVWDEWRVETTYGVFASYIERTR